MLWELFKTILAAAKIEALRGGNILTSDLIQKQQRQETAAFLSLKSVTKRYSNNFLAVDDFNLSLAKGQMVGFLGPSGCGKTTTLRMIAGLLTLTSGQITIEGDDISQKPPHLRDIGLVFQNYALFPHMSVADNVGFGLEMRGVSKRDAKQRIEEALEMVRLPGYGDRRPKDMSGGQQQRVALARALVIRPRLLLLDEPLSNLDAKLRDDMRLEIRDIQQQLGITTVFVTHDQVEALTMCDLVAIMDKGKIAQLGTPEEIYEKPSSLFSATFVGRANILDGNLLDETHVKIGDKVVACQSQGLDIKAHPRVKIAIRPHRIHLSKAGKEEPEENAFIGTVLRSTYIGDIVQYDIALSSAAAIKVEVPTSSGGQAYHRGDKVSCHCRPDDMLAFAA